MGIRRPRRPSPWEDPARRGKVLSLGREHVTLHLHVAFSALASEQRKGGRELAQGEVGPVGVAAVTAGGPLAGGPRTLRPEVAIWPRAPRGCVFGLRSRVGVLWPLAVRTRIVDGAALFPSAVGVPGCRRPPGLQVFSRPGGRRPDPHVVRASAVRQPE